MPSVDEIRTITIQAVSDGVDKATADINALVAAQGNLAVVSDTSTRAQTSVANALERQQTSLDTTYRAQKTFNQSQLAITTGFNEGLISVDRYNQLMQLAGQRFDDATKKATPLAQTFEGLKEKASDLAGELGPMGKALSAIGPVGIAIGAGIGVAILALDKLKEQASEAGQWAAQLENAANIIGLNTTQLQALNEAAASVGVSANDNISAFEKFSVSLGQLRDGTGSLYTQLLKVNPALVNQLSVTKDAATGWNLLAQAYAQADKQQQALISKAAFGRGGAAEGGVLLATANAGGIGGLQNEDAISQSQIAQWAKLTAQINQATEAAQHNFQSIFTTQILESEKAFADNMLNLSRYAKDFTLSDDFKSYLAKIGTAALNVASGLPLVGPAIVAGRAAAAGAGYLTTPGAIAAPAAARSPLPPAPNFDATFGAVAKSNSDQTAASMGVQAAQAKALVAALGSVATAQERLDATTKSLNVELANHTITQETYDRAIAGAKLDAVIAQQSAYVSALGQSAPIEEVVRLKEEQLQKLRLQNPAITQAIIDQQKALTASQALGTFQIDAQTDAEKIKINMLGMSTQAGLAYQLVQTKINEAIALGKPLTADQIADLQKSADAFAGVKVKADDYTSAINDAKNAASSFATDFVQGMLAGKTAAEALAASLKSVGSTLVSSGIKNLIQGAASADPIQAAIGGVEAIGGAIAEWFGGQSDAQKALEDAQLQWKRMAIDVVNFNLACKGFDLGPLTQQLQSLLSSYTQIQAAALKANDQADANQASIDFGNAVLRIVQQFKDGTPVLTPYAQAVKNLNDEAAGLEDTLNSLHDYSLANEVGIALGAQLTALAKQFADAMTDSLQQRINTAQGKDYLNQADALLTQHQQDVLQAQQLGISQSLVQQTFAAEAQKIVDDAGLVGDSFNDFITQFPQFAGVVHESSTALQDASDKFKQLTQTISDYLNNLALGSGSTLSPQDQLALAQSNFQKQLGLAAGGDQTALGSITQYADTYLNQAKGFYASSGGYADIYAAVTSALQSLIGSPASASSSLSGSTLTSVPPSIATGTSIPGVIMPQASVTSAANDNSSLFQAQTTQLSQVFTNVGQAQIVALQNGVADLGARIDKVTAAINSNRSKAPRPLQAALGLKSA